MEYNSHRVSPFGYLRVERLLTAIRSFSQFPTSFIGTLRLGIHRKPLVTSPRDAENSILFRFMFHALGFFYKTLFSCQGSGFTVDR